MGFLASAFSRADGEKALSLVELLRGTNGWASSASGKNVTVSTAIEVAAVLACTRVRANGVAQVPLKLMRESEDGRIRQPAKDHKLYDLLAKSPNDWQTSFEYREMIMFHLVLTGNHYSFINRSNRSGIMELLPFDPGAVTPMRDDNNVLTYEVRLSNGEARTFPAKAIWHVRGPSWDGWRGLKAVEIAREAVGLSMAIEEQQSRSQKNGVRTSGTYSVEGALEEPQYKALQKWIESNYAGPENAGTPMILDRGAKWLSTAMSGIDAQTLETRKFQVEEICRHMGVNPIMIYAESKNTTYASAEQMFLAHVVHTVAPDYERLEQSIDKNLLTEVERTEGLFANFVDEGMLRSSMAVKKDTIIGYIDGGVMTQNEGRDKLDLQPDADPESNKLHRTGTTAVGATP